MYGYTRCNMRQATAHRRHWQNKGRQPICSSEGARNRWYLMMMLVIPPVQGARRCKGHGLEQEA